jgi:hypothetical protein
MSNPLPVMKHRLQFKTSAKKPILLPKNLSAQNIAPAHSPERFAASLNPGAGRARTTAAPPEPQV